MTRPIGVVLWRGPSLYDPSVEVVVLAPTGSSKNRKTGGLLQTYILRADQEPHHALQAGADGPICGPCPRRSVGSGGDGGCYVVVGQGPLGVYRAWRRGRYLDISGDARRIAAIGAGRDVRLGAYGDPAAVPAWVWAALVSRARVHTGYTHGWRTTPELRGLAMASADGEADAVDAWGAGWRTFRVAPMGDATRLPGEARCPASAEAGRRVVCAACPLARSVAGARVPACGGASVTGPSIVIRAHGTKARRVRAAA